MIGKAWKSQAGIHRLFKSIGTSESITDPIGLRIIGQRTFFEKAKMMFIDGEHNQSIYGLERMGGETGRWEDDYFFSSIMKDDHNKVTGKNVIEALDKAMVEFRSKDITPDLILLSYEYSYIEQSFLEDKRFVSKLDQLYKGIDFYLGTFDNIPIYTSFSDFLKNRVIICNFKDAFKMRYQTNTDWFEQELTVDVREVSNEEAAKKLMENPARWKNSNDGIVLTEEEALILIKTSVIIDIWTTVDFQVLDTEAFIIGYIRADNPD